MELGPAESAYSQYQATFEREIEHFLAKSPLEGVLMEIAEYSLLDAGKRIRPVLCLAVGDSLGLDLTRLLSYCLATELLHNSSLIHDDLPSLDDDSLRRGRETVHIRFGEAQAILAADAFTSLAFRVISQAEKVSESTKVRWCTLLSEAFTELCQGQSLDVIEMKGGQEKASDGDPEQQLRNRHSLKTGALIRASVIGPTALLADSGRQRLEQGLLTYAEHFGLLFQITDDLEDYQELKDSQQSSNLNETTYVSLLGFDGARRRAQEVANQALAALNSIDYDTEFLQQLTLAVRDRG